MDNVGWLFSSYKQPNSDLSFVSTEERFPFDYETNQDPSVKGSRVS